MKTTIDIATPLFRQAKAYAAKQRITFREVVDEALRSFFQNSPKSSQPFKLTKAVFHGDGLKPGIEEGDWDTFRHLAYGDRE